MNKQKSLVDSALPFFVSLFMIGGIGGLIVYAFFKKEWIAILSFISFVPMVNVWIWQWLEDKKNKSFANKIAIITVLISICAIGYIFNKGSLGRIPLILIGIGVTAYVLWMVYGFFSAVDLWWQKALIIIAAAGFVAFLIFIKTEITVVECDRISNVVHTDIFENLTPPVIKEDLLKEKGTPDDIHVDYEEEDDGGPYKVEVWEYKRDAVIVQVVFIDDDYTDGQIDVFPVNLHAMDFFKDHSLIRDKSKRAYRVKLKAKNKENLDIKVNKDNTIRSINYY